MTEELTKSVYIVAGFLIVANIGTIVTVIFSALKLASTFGEMRAQLKQNTKDINNIGEKIRTVERFLLSDRDVSDS